MPSPIRLNKVLKELNISLDRAVEFLSSKKIEIEPRPTSKIDQDIYNLLLDEFQTDKSDKDKLEEINTKKRKELEEKQAEEKQAEEKQAEVISGIKTEMTESKPDKVSADNDKVEDLKIEPPKDDSDSSKIQTNFQKLSGIKKTGEVIDLDSLKKKEDKVEESKKRRRKRISKDVSQPKDSASKFNKNKKQAINQKVEPTDDEIQKQIRETLEKLQGKSSKSKGAKYRKDKRDQRKIQSEEEEALLEKESKIIKITEFITVGEIATLMDVTTNDIISACMSLGHFVSINQRLDAEIIQMVAEEFGFEVEFASAEDTTTVVEEEDLPENLKERAPIVTVMGHVDHGKTSLLDNIRKASVADGEAGGITQHIGAYSVKVETGQRITFLDTPGHEAFTAMRARGAKVTDIAIIIIAADDSIMPQTREAINHAQAAEVPMVFAINKIDKAGANPDKIKEELSQMNILVEDWGGKYQCQEISAKQGVGIDDLLEKVLLEAELMELKANPNRLAKGTIIESELDKGRGYVSTLLVQSGTLEIGSILVAGCYSGRVKAMTNEHGARVDVAGPSMPVQLLGLNGAPQAGDTFNAMSEEKEARDIASTRMQLQREQGIRATKHITLEEMGRRIAIGDFQELNVIVKGDVDGSIEALSDALLKLSTEQIQINIIHKSVGQISDTDVLLATASDAIIVGFQVRPSASARRLAEQEQIDIRLYSIIYKAIEELKDAMEGMLKPKIEEKVVANVEVRETFKISKVGTVAGCYVLDGTISRSSKIRIIREGIVTWSGELAALKRFKDDVKEVKFGYECGLSLLNYNDIQVGDVLEAFEEVEVKQTLKS